LGWGFAGSADSAEGAYSALRIHLQVDSGKGTWRETGKRKKNKSNMKPSKVA